MRTKSLVIAGLVALVVIVEVVRYLSGSSDAPPTDDLPVFLPDEHTLNQPSDPVAPAPTPGVVLPPEPPTDGTALVVPGAEIPDPTACLNFSSGILKKEGRGYTQEDMAYIRGQADPIIREALSRNVTAYIACKAAEQQDYSLCQDARRTLTPEALVPCDQLFSMVLVARAHFVMKMKPEQFEDLYRDLPKNVFDRLVAFMRLLAAQNPSQCDRLSTDPMFVGFCRIMAGEAPSKLEEPFEDVHYSILTLRTGQTSYLSKIPDNESRDLLRVTLGEKGVCEAGFDREMAATCPLVVP